MNKLGFLTLIQDILTVLETVEPGHFELRQWLAIRNSTAAKLWEAGRQAETLHTCGTVACVIGHCAIDPVFSGKYHLRLDKYTSPVYQPDQDELRPWEGLNRMLQDYTQVTKDEGYHLVRFLFSERSYLDRSLEAVKGRMKSLLALDAEALLPNMPFNCPTSKLVVFDLITRLKAQD